MIELQAKDSFQTVFDVSRFILLSPCDKRNLNTFNEVKTCISSLGSDTQLWNDGLFENYLSITKYFDDTFEKTAFFSDALSSAYIRQDYMARSKNYSMLSL